MAKYKYAYICLVDAIIKTLAATMPIVDGLISTTTGPTDAATAAPITPAAFRAEPGIGKFKFVFLLF